MNSTVRPLSALNIVFLSTLLLAAVISACYGSWVVAGTCAWMLAFVAWPIQRARRGKGGTVSRVNAFQPYDERDRELMNRSLALLGQFAFIGQVLLFLVAVARDDVHAMADEGVRLVVLCLVSLACTALVVRKA